MALSGCGRREPIERIVLVTIDTLRADHLGSYGYPRPTSPFLDSLAAQGVRFERAISASSHTAPSHTSIFTSLYPTHHGVVRNGLRLERNLPTLASVLAGEGLTTTAVTSVRFLKGISEDFEYFFGPRRGRYRPADETVDVAIDWIASQDENGRFLLWLHLYDVHDSDRAVAQKARLASHLEIMRQDAAQRGASFRDLLEHEHGVSSKLIRRDLDRINRYDAQLRFVDSQLRRLFNRLGGFAAAESTLWIVTSDHGEGLGSHSYVGHGKHLYREQLRVPLIAFGAGITREGKGVDSLVRTVDLFPTVLDLIDVPAPAASGDWEGSSFADLVRSNGARTIKPRIAYAERRPVDAKRLADGWTDESMFMARDETSKYILRSGGENEFYDLASDPLESVNLAGGGSEAEERLASWLTQKFDRLRQSGRTKNGDGEIDEEFIEELRSLGYLD